MCLGYLICRVRYLGTTTKELTEDAFLHIIQLPNAGGYAGCQLLIDVRVCAQFLRTKLSLLKSLSNRSTEEFLS